MFELTAENVAEYLHREGRIGPGPTAVELLGGGVSNVVLRVTTSAEVFVLKQSRPQLRTRDAWFSDLARVYRELEVMQALHPLLPEPTVPRVLWSDRPNYVFAMSHAPAGAEVWKQALLAGRVDLGIGERTGLVLGRIHQRTAERPELVAPFADHTVFVQLRVEPYYHRVQERRPEVADAVAPLVEQLLSVKEALCHGDYSPKNILTHAQGFTLVDYETGHFGDPTMDLGFFLSHLLLKAVKQHPRHAAYFELTRAFWRAYGAEVCFRPLAELQRRGIGHLAVCLLARIDGTSPVDYLPEEPKREAVRRIARRMLREKLAGWDDVVAVCDEECARMD